MSPAAPLSPRRLRKAAAGVKGNKYLVAEFLGLPRETLGGNQAGNEGRSLGDQAPFGQLGRSLFSGARGIVCGLGSQPGVLVKSICPRKQGTLTCPSCPKHDLGKNTEWRETSEYRSYRCVYPTHG